MKKFFKIVNKTEEGLIVAMFAVMVGIIFIQVIMRKLNNSLYWSEELGKFLFVWISWLGISIGEKRGEHIKITILTDKFSPKVQHIFNIISELVVIAICAVTVFYAIQLVGSQWGTRYAGIKISVGWGYLSVVLGCLFMILRSLGLCWVSLKGIKTGEHLSDMIAERNALEDGIPYEPEGEGGDA
ncbi:MAG: TRAP transporter small permease [Firmicutes bacterium]|nr:TRAP transporter small permease [Bacillota bacterium]